MPDKEGGIKIAYVEQRLREHMKSPGEGWSSHVRLDCKSEKYVGVGEDVVRMDKAEKRV